MKIRILPLIAAALIITGSFMSSCLNNDYEEFEYPSVSSIKSFSLGTLYQTIYKGGSKGQDTIDTVSYAKHLFVIDQINRKIYNVDSLPKGVDITKALINVTADGDVCYVNKNGKDTLLTSNDSLDLTKKLSLKVYTYSPVYKDFRFGKPYTVTVNVHKYNPDSLVWKHYEDKNFSVLTEQKAVFINNNIYVFGKEGNTTKVYRRSANRGNIGDSWEDITPSSPVNININSALAYDNDIYYVADNKMYRLSNNSQVGNLNNLSCLISVSNDSIQAYTTENTIISLDKDGVAGTKTCSSAFDFGSRFFAVSYPAEHNKNLWRTTVMSNSMTDTISNVFSHISSDNTWIKQTPNYPATCPNFDNISMIKYDGKLYAFGGKRGDKIKAFESFYYSNNNGFDWRIEPNEYMEFEPKVAELYNDKPYSCVVETDSNGKESFIWFVWYNGKISRANLNKFAPKI